MNKNFWNEVGRNGKNSENSPLRDLAWNRLTLFDVITEMVYRSKALSWKTLLPLVLNLLWLTTSHRIPKRVVIFNFMLLYSTSVCFLCTAKYRSKKRNKMSAQNSVRHVGHFRQGMTFYLALFLAVFTKKLIRSFSKMNGGFFLLLLLLSSVAR